MARPFGILLLALLGTARAEDAPSPATVEFFEKDVRPILVERCQKCHGAEKAKNGLRLDSRDAILDGGDTGPAVVPGKPDESLLIDAINYGDVYQMPPRSKLPAAEVAALTKWVAMGAPWPGAAGTSKSKVVSTFDLQARLGHWSFQPIQESRPPAVRDQSWPLNPIDRFILAGLEARGLRPAPDADRRTLIRRVTFDLTGLPPTPDEVADFLADDEPGSYERIVDRLLASPRYGERWARHWLDLVRFAETSGHEFDYDIPDAFRYRDYVIRALNDDLPYNRFVIEHIAGDLLGPPRRHPTEGFNESVLATGFYFLGEGTHSPVDVRDEQLRRIDNQIDVLSKTFLGLTVACARCHDHKFDPITARDYYALAGYLKSSRHQRAFIDPPGRIGDRVAELESLHAELRALLAATPNFANKFASTSQIAACLRAARLVLSERATPAEAARRLKVDEGTVDRWVAALRDPASRKPGHPLAAWAALEADGLGEPSAEWFEPRRARTLEKLSHPEPEDRSILFEGFDRPSFAPWIVTGDAFGDGPTRPGAFRHATDNDGATVLPVPPGIAYSGLLSDRLQGVLRSPTFTIEHKYIHYQVDGRGGRINLVVDGFEKIRDPIYGPLTFAVNRPGWQTQDVSMWLGHRAYIEIADGAVVDYTDSQARYVSGDGFLAVDQIRFSDSPRPPTLPDRFAACILGNPDVHSLDALAERFEAEVIAAADAWRSGRDDPDGTAALAQLASVGLMGAVTDPFKLWKIEERIPSPRLAPAMLDGPGEDEQILVRGNYRTPGAVAPRRFLEALAEGDPAGPSTSGSGRLELARRIADPSNPLTARVLVNRLWQHHFGAGIVRTPDDFGKMGQPPTHPQLIDDLAIRFIRSGWSLKAMHRLIVTSRAYRMSSRPLDPEAERLDPDNRLLHRMNVRRLEAEAIRDAILAVSGRLDGRFFGPSVPPHLTPFMDGRGRPAASGPLDGDGRRSLYLNVRRNFLNPLLLAFDFPTPFSTMGRRNVSNVPAQALTLLNDPFVLAMAHAWAERLTRDGTPEDRLDSAYLAAFGRPPTALERDAARAFLGGRDDRDAWAGLGHVLWNVKEFIFID